MPRSSVFRRTRGGRRGLARLVTVAATALLATGAVTGVAGAAGSADLGSLSDDSSRTATKVYDNITVTREIVDTNVGLPGDTFTYRTTISAVDGPARQVTRIEETPEGPAPRLRNCYHRTGATVTYTDATGSRVTDTVMRVAATGSWTVDAATGATVVYESTYLDRSEHRHHGGN
ncbi:hypothetical protein [Rhodococcus tukisamuensis]|uniref:Uncharacterized protein n=1 Tax=Rhodococcus tukisamuensis TaxID=168276 RepID=A0A1G6YJM0_9NOCA|nr:hypothetical protein [Rhodococcus tukisamuensis]SDD89897.1 hypothetical protein SAMN05444580_107187 [Rhodococcus tukisamuensis]